ncbi:DsbA family protein, partial [Actinocrispum sp. NPDC049592]|uniref:DsbA family oxidoreductase n=1 Tax=Actinocrispum sp. NPDC049592 TaxID=3154835 RepID=UPI0034479C99
MRTTGTAAKTSRPRVVTIEHWFDVICPFCYIAQDRNRILRAHGIRVVERALQIHPEIGPGGIPAGPRTGPTYDFLAHQAEAAGLPLNWSDRIPNSRPALAAYEWLAKTNPTTAHKFVTSVFTAYFANRQDIESLDLLLHLAARAGANPHPLHTALTTPPSTISTPHSTARASTPAAHTSTFSDPDSTAYASAPAARIS